MQKTKRFRLLTVLLAVVMMFALSIQAYAATSKPVTQDGLTATLVTDKDSYKTGESVNATVKIENNSGEQVFVFTDITVPSTVKLAGASAFDAVLANGQAWTSAAGVLSGTAGTTATGDQLQAGLWTVVSVLAIGGVVALLVYGKNRKTWVSMMLCVVMIGGLMAAAVPAQAAAVSGSMNLSCAIQVDGKAAEVTAVVNYIVGYEADSVTTTTPSEPPTTVPTETPSETPTVAPTETPSEDPTVAPTETPTEAPTEDPTVAPTAVPTEEPVEDGVPSENGYYVVWDDFTFCAINSWTDGIFSSWDIVLPQGAPSKVGDGAAFTDGSAYAKAQALRAFNAIAEDFTMEFTMKIAAGMEDTFVELKNEDTTAISFTVEGDKLFVGDEELCALPSTALKTFKLHISPANGTYTISVDGATVMDGNAAKEFTFENSTDAIDRLYIETGVADQGQVILGTVRAYVDYYVNEKFLDGTNLAINDEWTVTGNAATIYKKGTQGPDKYNALLSDGASITREATYEQDGAWVEYQHLMEVNQGEFAMILSDDAGNTFKVATKNGKFGYYNGTEFVELYDCVANLWYHVMLKQTDAGTELYLNHKLKEDGITLPFDKFTNITFTMTGGEAMLDDIIVKDWIPLPEDYVPEPVAVEKEEGATLVGLQSCNIWVEGEHFGYDWLTDWPERTPILGYYDEMLPEAADWELKLKVEHGIDFELYCWYRPSDGQNEPIKMPRNSRALHDGYMNAEYSDMMKFAITWESGSGGQDLADFKENIVPYWIEQYFKDDRYMVIDNKPLIGMYNITKLKSYFGGTIAGVKEAMDYLRQACVDAGFDGAYIIMCNATAANAKEIAEATFDGQYAYSWGTYSFNPDSQTRGMTNMQNTLVTAGESKNGVVPVISQGWWSEAWDRDQGGFISAEDYKSVLQWVKDEFIPTLDEESIGSKMILLDNWNEYAEGHFIMPSEELYGFGYIDAVREVFGDGDGADGEHVVNDIAPSEAQLERINHMYIQDRHVVLVDKNKGNDSTEPMPGYNWTFDVNDDAEGWTVAANDGKWIKDLTEWYVRGGKFYGKTLTPTELEAGVAAGTYVTGATADPSILSPDNLNLNANEAIAIKIRLKGVSGEADLGRPAVYFTTTDDPKYSSSKMVDAIYEEGADGYAELTWAMNTNKLWTGTIKQLRFDPIARDGEFWIDSIQIYRRKVSGDAEVYLDGERVYTKQPIMTVDGSYLFPAEELSTMTDVYVIESLEKDRLYVSTDTAFFEFPYEGDVKMIVDGEAVNSVGATIIDGVVYVPIVDVFSNMGTVTNALGEVHNAYEVEVIPATTDALAKINVSKYVDPSILKGYYFTTTTEGWTYGGKDVTKVPAVNGAGAIESTAVGTDTKYWSPQDKHFNINAVKADHIRMRISTDAATATPTIKMTVYGDGTSYYYAYNITLTESMLGDDGYYTVLVDLEEAKAAALKHAKEIDRVCIYWYDAAAGGTQTFAMDSFEILDIVEDDAPTGPVEVKVVVEESPYTIYDWDFNESIKGWAGGGSTGIKHNVDEEALTVTVKSQRANVWSSNTDANGVIQNPMNVSTAEATHILVRVESEEELTVMGLDVQYLGADGKSAGGASYKDVPYVTDVNGDLYALVDLTDNANWKTDQTLARINIYPIGNTITEADNGKVVNITSVEVLDKNWFIEFDSTYFTSSIEGYVQGGTTKLRNEEQALAVYAPTVTNADGELTDFNPRLWSMNNDSANKPKTPYEYTKDEVTHIRVRVKAVLPDTLPDTLTDDEKAALAQITTEDLKLNLQFSDGSGASGGSLSYPIGAEDYVTLTYDISGSIWPDDKTLGRIGFNVYDGGNELLCKAGAVVMIDSVQFLRRTGADDESQALKVLIIGNSITQHNPNLSYGWAADWGMAATSRDKDYVHLLESQILAKNDAVEVKAVNISPYEKYFYDWTMIGDTKDKYANWNADIIIATFGANVKNGANENDSSYENDYIFSPDKYKKIIDKFNPDGDALVIAGATALTNSGIVDVIAEAASTYGYTYVDMTEWTAREYLAHDYEDEILAYYREVTGDTTLTSVNSGVLNHPGDKGMEKIAEELWAALDPMIPQGTTGGNEEDDEEEKVLMGDNTGAWASGDTTYESLAHGWYFTTGKEGWFNGGPTSVTGANGFLVVTGADANGARTWSGSEASLTIAAADADTVRVRVNTTVADPVMTLMVTYNPVAGSTVVTEYIQSVSYTPDQEGWATVTFDLSTLASHTAEYTIGRIGLYPFGISTPAAADSTANIDYVEILKKVVAGGEEPGEEPETESVLALSWDFEEDLAGWAVGGAAGISRKRDNDTEPYYLALSQKDGSKAQFWTNGISATETTYPAIDVATLDKIELRVKSLTTETHPLELVIYEWSASPRLYTKYTTAEVGSEWTVITIDAADIDWDAFTTAPTTVERFAIRSTKDVTAGEQIFAIDYMKIYTKVAEEEPEEEPEVESVLALSWDFEEDLAGWAVGGTGGVARRRDSDTEPYYLALTQKSGSKALFWTNGISATNTTYPAIDVATLDKLELRVKTLTTEPQDLELVIYEWNSSPRKYTIHTIEAVGSEWTVITIDASDINWEGANGAPETIERFALRPAQTVDPGEVLAIDYLNVYTKAE